MVSCTCRTDSSFFLLLSQLAKSSGSSPDFEAANHLQVFSFEVDVGIVLFGEEGRFLKFGGGHNLFVFSIGLIDFVSRYKFGHAVNKDMYINK